MFVVDCPRLLTLACFVSPWTDTTFNVTFSCFLQGLCMAIDTTITDVGTV